MDNLVAISNLFDISLDELVLDKAQEPEEPAKEVVKSELYSDIKEHVLTEANKEKAKKGLKIAGIALGVFLLIDVISLIVYVIAFGFPK